MRDRNQIPRRDRLYLISKRMQLLDPRQAAAAWYHLAGELEAQGTLDMPKFKNIVRSIRAATIQGRTTPANPPTTDALSELLHQNRKPRSWLSDNPGHNSDAIAKSDTTTKRRHPNT